MPRNPANMTNSQINRELEKTLARLHSICDRLIAAGRGLEKPSETLTLSDNLSLEYQSVAARHTHLQAEVYVRYGGYTSRLPHGGARIRAVAK